MLFVLIYFNVQLKNSVRTGLISPIKKSIECFQFLEEKNHFCSPRQILMFRKFKIVLFLKYVDFQFSSSTFFVVTSMIFSISSSINKFFFLEKLWIENIFDFVHRVYFLLTRECQKRAFGFNFLPIIQLVSAYLLT